MYPRQPKNVSFQIFFSNLVNRQFNSGDSKCYLVPGKYIKSFSLFAFCFIVLGLNARADYTIASGSNIDASAITSQSGVLTINGTLTVSSNVTLAGFTSVVINAPNGQIYWTNNSDITFSAGTTLDIAAGAPGLQAGGNNSSQRLIVGTAIIAVSNNNSAAADFSFDQFNAMGGLPEYTVTSNNPCAGSAISASIVPQKTVTGIVYSYVWSIDPSSGSFTYNSDHSTASTLQGVGSYTLTCIASANTYKDTFNLSVTVKPLPATPSPSVNSPICTGATINLSTAAVSGATYSWSGPGSFSSTGRTTTRAAATTSMSGTYSVIVTSSQGCNSAAGSITVTVNSLPSTPTATSNSPICSGSSLNLNTPAIAGNSYSWSGPGGFSSNSNTPVISNATIALSGTYSVIVTSSAGCSSAAGNTAVIINAVPSNAVPSSNSPVCPGTAITLTTSNLVGASYIWSGPNGFTSSTRNPTLTNATSVMAGTYTVTVTSSSGCAGTPANTVVLVNPSYTWFGSNIDWANISNWCPGVPTSAYDVTIPSTSNNPVIAPGTTATVHNLTIASGATLTVNGKLQVKGTITNNGTLDVTNGTLEMNGTSAQSIAGSMFYNKTVKNLIASNTAGLSVSSTVNDTLKISGGLTFGDANAVLNTGDNIELLSTASGTAYLGTVGSGNAITGKAIVDRYINVGNGSGQHPKAWEFLSFPTDGATVKASIMENGNNIAGYGIWLTAPQGTVAGFDASSYSAAIKSYNASADSWVGVTNASNLIHNTEGYMVFVRGDRTVNGTTVTGAKATILRSKGNLLTGAQASISVLPDHYQSIGNPYPSTIDFTQITRANGVDNLYYAWDPYLNGNYGYGGYQTISASNGWVPVPGGTNAYPSGEASSIIQSGQAFFVHAATNPSFGAQTPSITINENSKVVTSNNVNFARKAERVKGTREFLRTDLYLSTNPGAAIADGNAVAFDMNFSNKVDGNDASKLMNSGENFGIKRDGKILAVDAKAPLGAGDTILFNMTNMKRQTYLLKIVPVNMQGEVLQAFLRDNFLDTIIAINLSDTNLIPISITTNLASAAPNRFSIVFRSLAALPVTLSSVQASAKDNMVLVVWTTENESGMMNYEVQKSADGIAFEASHVTAALNSGSASYGWTDTKATSGTNYYRIKSVSKDGKISFSAVVKVNVGKITPIIAVAPNPVVNGTIHLVFTNEPVGNYTITISNQLGQVVLSREILHSSLSSTEDISGNNITKGIYNLSILKPCGNKEVMKVVIN